MTRALLAAVAVVLLVPAAAAAETPSMASSHEVRISIETNGVTYAGRQRSIDSAYCIGLRRFGTVTFRYQEYFHRLKCSAYAADGRWYQVQVAVFDRTRSGSFTYRELSIVRVR